MPNVPKVPMAFGMNAAVLKYWAICAARDLPEDNVATPTWSGVSEPVPVRELSHPQRTVNGNPDWRDTIPSVLHPPRIGRNAPPCRNHGSSQINEETKRCVTSLGINP